MRALIDDAGWPPRLRLHDGDDSAFAAFTLPLEGNEHPVSLNNFEPLHDNALHATAMAVALETQRAVRIAPDVYQSVDGLRLYFAEGIGESQCHVVISAGEFQPSRYMINVEGYVQAARPSQWLTVGYVLMQASADPNVVGHWPQIHGFHEPPSPSIYSDRAYARRHLVPLPPDVRMDLFDLHTASEPTDVLSAGMLRSSGLFVSQRSRDLLADFVLSETFIHPARAHHRGAFIDISFVQMLASSAVDYQRSTFRVDGGMHSAVRAVIQLDGLEAVHEKKRELVATPDRPALLPASIVLNSFPDLLHVPATIDFAISHRLLRAMNAASLTGIELTMPNYQLG